MIVQKPQFDVDNIKVGNAYWLTKTVRRYSELSVACLVIGVSPLVMDVSFYDVTDTRMRTISIAINEVVNGVFKIENMEVVKNG